MSKWPPATIFVYEYATAGGAWGAWHRPDLTAELALEGKAMAFSLAEDLWQAGYSVWLMQAEHDQVVVHDQVLPNTPENRCALFHWASTAADAVWIIAPEIDFIHWHLTRSAELCGARLLSPHSAFIELTQDKHATAEWLRQRGVPAPAGWPLGPDAAAFEQAHGWVIKPRLGAGSLGVRRAVAQTVPAIASSDTHSPVDGRSRLPMVPGGWRAEAYCQGQAVSVAAICDGSQALLCPPCRQERNAENEFSHQGWSAPYSEAQGLCHTMVRQALNALPPTRGYIGFDLILGDQNPGTNGWVIEVNPRLTTSYLCLRKRYQGNLAAAMMNFWCGQSVTWGWSQEFAKVTTDELKRCVRIGEHRQCRGWRWT